jgi:hypothetical protein
MSDMEQEGASEMPVMGRAIVNRGHTVCIPDGNKKTVVGYDPVTGKPIERVILRDYGPDQEVELPVEEIARLRTTGHLVDPARIYKIEDGKTLPGEASITETSRRSSPDGKVSITRV